MNNSRCTPVLVHPQVNRVATELSDLLSRFDRYSEALANQLGHGNTKLTLLLGLTESEYTEAKSWGFAHLDIIRIAKPTSNFLYFGL